MRHLASLIGLVPYLGPAIILVVCAIDFLLYPAGLVSMWTSYAMAAGLAALWLATFAAIKWHYEARLARKRALLNDALTTLQGCDESHQSERAFAQD